MASNTTNDADVLSDINVTPLVDVMLVLLVVMMVTASTVVTKSMSVDLPRGTTGTSTPKSFTVTVKANGEWMLDDRSVDAALLRRALRKERARGSQIQALIAADGAARHRAVVEVLDLLRDERVERVAVGVSPAPDGER